MKLAETADAADLETRKMILRQNRDFMSKSSKSVRFELPWQNVLFTIKAYNTKKGNFTKKKLLLKLQSSKIQFSNVKLQFYQQPTVVT